MSLTGMVPVGGFLLQHLFANSYIFVSQAAYDEHSRFLLSLPMVVLLELGMIYVPILLHALLGLAIVYRGEQNFTVYSQFRNWMYFFQRLSGVVALAFIGVHTYTTRISAFFFGREINAARMSEVLRQPFWFWFYLIGIVMIVFHFANGLWSFLITWGITVNRRAQRISSAVTMGLFVVMAMWGVAILMKFT